MLKRIFFTKLLLLCFVLSLSNLTHAKANSVSEFTLKNGLKLIVVEDHRAPIVNSQIWYKVGSSYESQGITGISHMLEHLMFKGTDKHPKGELVKLVMEVGGQQNAFTSYDYTGYYQKLPIENLELSFKFESDRMQNLSFNKAETV